MTTKQRMKNDIATTDKREMADKTIRDSRIRNDEMTVERRFKADKAMNLKRSKNDEITNNRREMKNGNLNATLAIVLLGLVFLGIGLFFI